MAPEAIAADRAYRLLKADLMSGRFGPSTTLIERVLASEYGVSVSPLRDGAQRLVGEGMIDIVSTGGYRVPGLSEGLLRDLYRWHDHLVRLALKDLVSAEPIDTEETAGQKGQANLDDVAVAHAATALFRSFAQRARNGQLSRALHAANDRLVAIRLKEGQVLDNLASELAAVTLSTTSGSGPAPMDALRAYHRRRNRRAVRIVAVMTGSS